MDQQGGLHGLVRERTRLPGPYPRAATEIERGADRTPTSEEDRFPGALGAAEIGVSVMLEENVAYEDGASVYRAGYNPAFIAQARKNNFQRDLERLERELAAARRQIEALRDENASLRLQCERVLSARPVDADSFSVDDLHSMGSKVSVKDIIRVIA